MGETENLNTWCRLVAVTSVASAVFMLIVPEGRVKSGYKILLTVILVFSFLYPLKGKSADFLRFDDLSDFITNENVTEIESYRDSALILAAESETERYLQEVLTSMDKEYSCSVKCYYDGEKITIESVEIEGKVKEEDRSLIYEKIKEITDEETEVRINGEIYE